jgi:hypothetical protein
MIDTHLSVKFKTFDITKLKNKDDFYEVWVDNEKLSLEDIVLFNFCGRNFLQIKNLQVGFLKPKLIIISNEKTGELI